MKKITIHVKHGYVGYNECCSFINLSTRYFWLIMSKSRAPITFTDPKWVQELLLSIIRRISALQDRAMKHTVLVEMLEVLSPDELVDFLVLLCEEAAQGKDGARTVHQELALEPSALSLMPYKHIQKCYAIASTRDEQNVMGMFMGEPLRGSPTVDESFTGNDHLDISLGQRRAAARSTDRFILDRLLHDRNPLVISLLLENPKIVERDVVKIAALRPTQAEILVQISKHRRWASRYHVRKALTCNPYTPHQIARRLMATLMMQDIRMLYTMGVLPTSIRAEAERLMAERKRVRDTATGIVHSIEMAEPQENANIADIAQEWLSQIDIEEEEAYAMDTTLVGEEEDDDDWEALFAQAELDLATAVLVEVGEEESSVE